MNARHIRSLLRSERDSLMTASIVLLEVKIVILASPELCVMNMESPFADLRSLYKKSKRNLSNTLIEEDKYIS